VVDRGAGKLGHRALLHRALARAAQNPQEAITLAVFVPFAILYMDQPVKLDYLWAALCIMGAVYFIFRG